jgi:cyclopropane fatty-acyl-phospholipid synthase-like methyltransferase
MARTFIPAAGHDWLLPLYDPLARLLGAASAHRHLVDQAQLQAGHRVLEIGCGTGNLTIQIKTRHPSVDVVGLDPDPKALARARRKAVRVGIALRLDQGFSDQLPYADGSYDRVFSAFMFHHLLHEEKRKSLQEIRRVLRPGGSFHLLDVGSARGSGGFIARFFHRSDRMRGSSVDTILILMQEAGFADPTEVSHRRAIFGRVFFCRGSRASSATAIT